MGQAAVDLPDPLETPPTGKPPASAAGTDELLSQLAGEEINRLLRDADLEPDESAAGGPRAVASPSPPVQPPPGGPRATSVATASPEPDPVLDAELDDLMSQLGGIINNGAAPAIEPNLAARSAEPPPAAPATKVPPAVTPAPSPTPESDPETVAALDSVFDQLTSAGSVAAAPAPETGAGEPVGESPRASTSSVPPPAEAPPVEAAPATEASSPAASPPPDATASDMARVLDSVIESDAEAEAAAAASSEERAALDDGERVGAPSKGGGVPGAVRLLRLINSPWAAIPEPLLDAAGKVGILTLINAVAVLLYVLLFRHK